MRFGGGRLAPRGTGSSWTQLWREPDSNLYGAFPVKSCFWFVAGSLFGAGKPSSSRRLRSGSRSTRSDDELRDELFAHHDAWSVPVDLLRIRGELAIGDFRVTDLYTAGSWILTMMRSCASAAKLRAAGPFYRSASSARFEYGVPPPRIVNSAVVLKSQRERRMVLSAMLVPVSPFRMLDVRRRPPMAHQS